MLPTTPYGQFFKIQVTCGEHTAVIFFSEQMATLLNSLLLRYTTDKASSFRDTQYLKQISTTYTTVEALSQKYTEANGLSPRYTIADVLSFRDTRQLMHFPQEREQLVPLLSEINDSYWTISGVYDINCRAFHRYMTSNARSLRETRPQMDSHQISRQLMHSVFEIHDSKWQLSEMNDI